ncbi:hypothetical protein [uncultured Ruminococcus sp.]|uniref:hypothetical protein n=1 Tax=uncultured Ruminococcus sp. TaxID=165186 RepID=UPI0025FD3BC2|nr:hypothetical protein [uncultured Ruminococcus sp.]
MSRSAEYDYYLAQKRAREIERQIRQARQQAEYEARRRANETRIRNNTEQFYQRYLQQYEDMRSQGVETYMPNEMERLRSDLSQIRSLLYSNPGAARDVSFRIGEYIHSMYRDGHAAEREYRRREIEAERQRQEEERAERLRKQGEINDAYYDLVSGIQDQAVINFAAKELSELRQKALDSVTSMSVSDLRQHAERIIAQAQAKASEWEDQSKKKEEQQVVTERLQMMQEQLTQKKVEDQEKAQVLMKQIVALQEQISSDSKPQPEIEQELAKIESDMDDTLISEDVRREAVKSVFLSLKKQGFQVKPPQLVQDQNHNYVRIVAQKPSGKRVQCRLDLHGKLLYKFDEYEGMTCLKDIEQFNVELEQVYSISLSDERIIWENPDRLSKDSHSTTDPKRRNQ